MEKIKNRAEMEKARSAIRLYNNTQFKEELELYGFSIGIVCIGTLFLLVGGILSNLLVISGGVVICIWGSLTYVERRFDILEE